MTDKAFIEFHRTYQDEHKKDGHFPEEIVSRYRDLAKDYPDKPVYSYLAARVEENFEKRLKLAEEMVEHWPKFSYAHQFLGYVVGYEQEPCNFSRALTLFRKASELDRSIELKNAINELELAEKFFQKAKALTLTYNLKALNRYSTRKVKIVSRSPSSLDAEYFQNEYVNHKWEMVKKTASSIEMKYVRPTAQLTHYPMTWATPEVAPGFEYEITVKSPLDLRIEKVGVPKEAHRHPEIFVRADAFRNNKVKIYLTSEDLQDLRHLELVELNN